MSFRSVCLRAHETKRLNGDHPGSGIPIQAYSLQRQDTEAIH